MLEVQIEENKSINLIVKKLETKVIELSDERERYLSELLKNKGEQAERFD